MVFFLQGKVKCMNRRSVKIMRRKAGGTAGKNAEKYSVNLPAVWLHAMGLSKEDRVELSFDGEKITIQPLASTDPEVFRRNAEQKGHQLKEYRYYDGDVLCTVILADFTAQQVCVENKIDDVLDTAFGVNETPSWEGLIVVRNYKSCGWGRERCDRKGHAVFLRPRVDSAIMGSASTGISTSSTKLKKISTFCRRLPPDLSGA